MRYNPVSWPGLCRFLLKPNGEATTGEFDMKAELTAIYIDGLLKPDEELALPNQTRVKLTVETIGHRSDASAVWDGLKTRLSQRPVHGGGKHFTRDELHERR